LPQSLRLITSNIC